MVSLTLAAVLGVLEVSTPVALSIVIQSTEGVVARLYANPPPEAYEENGIAAPLMLIGTSGMVMLVVENTGALSIVRLIFTVPLPAALFAITEKLTTVGVVTTGTFWSFASPMVNPPVVSGVSANQVGIVS